MLLEVEFEKFTLFLMHLSLGSGARKAQIEEISRICENRQKPVILAGDGNAFTGPGEFDPVISRCGLVPAGGAAATYPSAFPLLPLTWSSAAPSLRAPVFRTSGAALGSPADHMRHRYGSRVAPEPLRSGQMMSFPVRIALALAALSLLFPLPSSAQELEKVPLSVMELISGGEQVGMKLEEYENSLLQRPDGKPSERRTFPPALFMLEYLLSRHLPGEWKGPLYPDRGRDFWEKRDFPVLEKAGGGDGDNNGVEGRKKRERPFWLKWCTIHREEQSDPSGFIRCASGPAEQKKCRR